MRAEGGEQAVRPPRLRAASQRALLQLQWAYKLLLLQGEAAASVSPTSYCRVPSTPASLRSFLSREKHQGGPRFGHYPQPPLPVFLPGAHYIFTQSHTDTNSALCKQAVMSQDVQFFPWMVLVLSILLLYLEVKLHPCAHWRPRT